MSKIIGTCLGEYVREEDVLYDPQTDTYKIKAGDRIMEIPGYSLQSESIRTLKEALSNVDDENIKTDILGTWAKARSKPIDYKGDEAYDDIYRKTCLGDWGPRASGEAKTAVEIAAAGANPGSQSIDPLRARVEAGGWRLDGHEAGVRPADPGSWGVRCADEAAEKLRANGVYGVGTAGRASAPWDDPLKDRIDKASNTVACMDMPELKPDYNPNNRPKIYYHDRFPSIPIRSIIDDAIELLNNKKNLHITKISFSQSHPEFFLAISSNRPHDPGGRKVLEVSIHHSAFDRVKQEIDDYAGLKAKLDADAYIKLRIAFLLYEALKLRDEDALEISLNIFKVHGSVTRPNFSF